MTKTVLLSVAATLIGVLPLVAQESSSRVKPLSEKQLLNTIDSLAAGDPTTKAPLSIDDTQPSTSSQRERRKEEQKAPQSGNGPTEITAQEASFDQKAHQAVFAGNVVVKNPEFNITCDKLTAFLRNENGKEKPNPAATNGLRPVANQGNAPVKPAKSSGAGGLEKVIADGSVVITQDKLDAEGNVNRSVGKARRAVYDANTGDVTLTGRPELQQGINACVATDDSTVIILNREGRMKVSGPSKTVIREAPENPTAPNGR